MNNTHILYGTPLSLYTGKARSYLIKNQLPYREITPTTEHFSKVVRPAAKQLTLPTLETADGQVIRDSTAIIDHFESPQNYPARPASPQQRIVSLLFDVIGSEGLLRPAMHYRWDYPDENLDFLRFHFQTLIPANRNRVQLAEANMGRMQDAGRAFGATEETFALVESLYTELLALFDAHFARVPYLLGGKPGIGDFGLMAPLYAHLGRDPKPLTLMQLKSVRLLRWVERMNRPDPDSGEFENPGHDFLPEDEIPDTLKAVLRHLAIDFVPETLAATSCINSWINQQPELPAGTPFPRAVGVASFEVRDTKVSAIAQPYRFFLLQRVQDGYDSMNKDDQQLIMDLLAECHLSPLLEARLERRIGQHDNLDVWL